MGDQTPTDHSNAGYAKVRGSTSDTDWPFSEKALSVKGSLTDDYKIAFRHGLIKSTDVQHNVDAWRDSGSKYRRQAESEATCCPRAGLEREVRIDGFGDAISPVTQRPFEL